MVAGYAVYPWEAPLPQTRAWNGVNLADTCILVVENSLMCVHRR